MGTEHAKISPVPGGGGARPNPHGLYDSPMTLTTAFRLVALDIGVPTPTFKQWVAHAQTLGEAAGRRWLIHKMSRFVRDKTMRTGKCKFCGAPALLLIESDEPPKITGPMRTVPGKHSVVHPGPVCAAYKRAVAQQQPCIVVDKNH